MIGSASAYKPQRVHRCGACRQQVADPRAADVLDCPRCGALAHLGCAWDAPRCRGCGEALATEVAHRARRSSPSRVRGAWESLRALLRDLRARPMAVLAECHSDRGRWMGISVAMFLLGIGLAIAITLLVAAALRA